MVDILLINAILYKTNFVAQCQILKTSSKATVRVNYETIISFKKCLSFAIPKA